MTVNGMLGYKCIKNGIDKSVNPIKKNNEVSNL